MPQRMPGESTVLIFFFFKVMVRVPNSRGTILGTSQLFEWFMLFLILSIIQCLSNVIFTNNIFTYILIINSLCVRIHLNQGKITFY